MMIKKTNISERIFYIIENQYNGNKKKFAESINFSPQVISNIVSGRKSKPSFDVLKAILSTNDDINAEWLLTGVEPIYKHNYEAEFQKDPFHKKLFNIKDNLNPEPPKLESKTPQVITVDQDNEDNIVMVPVKAQAGYLTGFDDPEYIKKLPTYTLPNLRNGIFRMFQVSGFSMVPTLHHHSNVVGQFVENWQDDIKDNRIYVLVTKEHGVVVKRCLNRIEKYGTIYCKSDNRSEFPSFALETPFIAEIWEVKMALIHDLADPADLHDKMNDLESELMYIKQHLNLSKTLNKVVENPDT